MRNIITAYDTVVNIDPQTGKADPNRTEKRRLAIYEKAQDTFVLANETVEDGPTPTRYRRKEQPQSVAVFHKTMTPQGMDYVSEDGSSVRRGYGI